MLARADDPNSGGRQMPNHWGCERLGIITGSSPIATQLPHAAGLAYASKLRRRGPGRGQLVRRGGHVEGRLPRGPELRRASTSCRWCSSARTTATRSRCRMLQGVGGRRTSPSGRTPTAFGGVIVDGNDAARRLRGGALRRPAGAAGRGPHAGRVQDLPLPGPHLRRRRPHVPHAAGGRGLAQEGPAAAHHAVPHRAAAAVRGRRGARSRPRCGPRSTTPPRRAEASPRQATPRTHGVRHAVCADAGVPPTPSAAAPTPADAAARRHRAQRSSTPSARRSTSSWPRTSGC